MSVALVTGAGGFVGGAVAAALRDAGWTVRAGTHHASTVPRGTEPVPIDLEDPASLSAAVRGVDAILHFAALTDPRLPRAQMYRINTEGTRLLWQVAAEIGIDRALLCSTSAVYGILSIRADLIEESEPLRAVEAYGRSKIGAEEAASEIAHAGGPRTIILRPVAVFGPGASGGLSAELRRAATTRLAMGGALENRRFSFVHLADVAAAAVFVLGIRGGAVECFNVAVEPPISFEEAATAWSSALARAGPRWKTARVAAHLSGIMRARPALQGAIRRFGVGRLLYGVGRPGHPLICSSRRLRETGFVFRHTDFEEVLLSCLQS